MKETAVFLIVFLFCLLILSLPGCAHNEEVEVQNQHWSTSPAYHKWEMEQRRKAEKTPDGIYYP